MKKNYQNIPIKTLLKNMANCLESGINKSIISPLIITMLKFCGIISSKIMFLLKLKMKITQYLLILYIGKMFSIGPPEMNKWRKAIRII